MRKVMGKQLTGIEIEVIAIAYTRSNHGNQSHVISRIPILIRRNFAYLQRAAGLTNHRALS